MQLGVPPSLKADAAEQLHLATELGLKAPALAPSRWRNGLPIRGIPTEATTAFREPNLIENQTSHKKHLR